jgi:hypothetical protein
MVVVRSGLIRPQKRVSVRLACPCTAPKFHSGTIIECEAVLQEAFDWGQRSSVAADNNRIYAEDLVTSRQTHFYVASFQLC